MTSGLVFTRDLGASVIRSASRDGFTRVRRGAYMHLPEDLQRWERDHALALARCQAAAAQLRTDAVFSHQTAALLHGWELWRVDEHTHLIQPARPNSSGDRGLVRHFTELPSADRTVVRGVPVTSIERTILDCAGSLHPKEALVVVDSAFRSVSGLDQRASVDGRRTMEQLRTTLLARLADRRGSRGIVQARAVIRAANGLAESPGESSLRWIVVSRGVPPPVLQIPVQTRAGLFFSDLGWRLDDGLVVLCEYDGMVKYRDLARGAPGRVVEREKAREDALRETGARVLRFTQRDLLDPAVTFERIRSALPPSMWVNARPVPGLVPIPRPHQAPR
ncbi:hypothetical protein [Georgenia faecalis]|uniref:hypothetical protein n=1 Tax=Georgenia faecalis TaxID=2483799 RepID=UPI000FD98D6B|nr:hypothetical protein [Georgenia faecalis]